jgi:hypothetical protein
MLFRSTVQRALLRILVYIVVILASLIVLYVGAYVWLVRFDNAGGDVSSRMFFRPMLQLERMDMGQKQELLCRIAGAFVLLGLGLWIGAEMRRKPALKKPAPRPWREERIQIGRDAPGVPEEERER